MSLVKWFCFFIFVFHSTVRAQRFVDFCGADRLTGRTPDEQKILCKVFRSYSPLLRPVRNWTTTVRVGISLAINQIFELDERNQLLITNAWIDQEWNDEYMVWNPDDYGIDVLRIPARYLWLPDIMLYNNGADYVNRFVQTRAMVKFDGTVFFPTPVKLYSSCTIDTTYFPFDTQTCWLKFGSWSHDTNFVDIYGRVDEVDLSRFVNNGEWDIMDIYQKRHIVHYSCCVELFSDLTFYIVMKRKVLYYVVNIFFPSFVMSSLTLLSFLMPPDSGEKLTLGITVLLSFSVFMLSVTEKLPETSEYVPLMSIYLCVVMSMLSFSITGTIFVLSVCFRRPTLYSEWTLKRPPKLARRFAEFFARNGDYERFKKSNNTPVEEAIRKAEATIKQQAREAALSDVGDIFSAERRTSGEREGRQRAAGRKFKGTKAEQEEKPLSPDEKNNADECSSANSSGSTSFCSASCCSSATSENSEAEHLRIEMSAIVNRLTERASVEARMDRIILEWQLLSAAIDRVLFTLFVFMTTSAVISLLVITPAMNNYFSSPATRSGSIEYSEFNSSTNGNSSTQQENSDKDNGLVEYYDQATANPQT